MIIPLFVGLHFLQVASSYEYRPPVITFEGEILGLKPQGEAGGACDYASILEKKGPDDHWFRQGCFWATKENRNLKAISDLTNVEKCMEQCAAEEKCTHFNWRKNSCRLMTGYELPYEISWQKRSPYEYEPTNDSICGVKSWERAKDVFCLIPFVTLLNDIYKSNVYGGGWKEQ